MERIDKKELEGILVKHTKSTNDKLDLLTKHGEKTDSRLEMIADDIGTIKEKMGHLEDDVSVLKVDVSGMKVDMLNLTEKVDVIFEQTGKLTVDMEKVKESVQRHEQKIGQI